MAKSRTVNKGKLKQPGEMTDKAKLARMLRVDHAGEFAATQIYAGQMRVLKGKPEEPVIAEMAAQEVAHLQAFEKLLVQHHVRPSALSPFWRVAAYALGAGTAALGPKAAMACTVAVEDEIAEHYASQLNDMPEGQEKLAKFIAKTRDEEIHHRDTGLDFGAEQAPAYRLLYKAIRTGCRVAIKVAERV